MDYLAYSSICPSYQARHWFGRQVSEQMRIAATTRFGGEMDLHIPKYPDHFAGMLGDGYLELACAIIHTCASSGYVDELALLLDEHMQGRGYTNCGTQLVTEIIQVASRERPKYCDNQLRTLREQQGSKQRAFARLVGITSQELYGYEVEDLYPNQEIRQRIATALGVTETAIWQM